MTSNRPKAPIHPDRIVDPGSLPHAVPKWRGNLPHIAKEGCTYFVTFCLADAAKGRKGVPPIDEVDDCAIQFADQHDPISKRGSCLLREPEIAARVEETLLHFQGDRYVLSAWCVMPNHVHVVVTPLGDHNLSSILHSWKSFSAHEINKRLGRQGSLWEEEAFDHIVRDERSMERFVRYIENNPVAAGLCNRPESWPFSSARFQTKAE